MINVLDDPIIKINDSFYSKILQLDIESIDVRNYDLIVIDSLESNLDKLSLFNVSDIIKSNFHIFNAAILGNVYAKYLSMYDIDNLDYCVDEFESSEFDYTNHLFDSYGIMNQLSEYFCNMVENNDNIFSWNFLPRDKWDLLYSILSEYSFIAKNKIINDKKILLIDDKEPYNNNLLSYSAISFLKTYTYKDVNIIKLWRGK